MIKTNPTELFNPYNSQYWSFTTSTIDLERSLFPITSGLFLKCATWWLPPHKCKEYKQSVLILPQPLHVRHSKCSKILSALINSRNKARWKSIPTVTDTEAHTGVQCTVLQNSTSTAVMALLKCHCRTSISLSGLKDTGFMAQCHPQSIIMR